MSSTFALLLVDDDEHKRSLIAHFLRRRLPDCLLLECENGLQAIEALKSHAVRAVITDHSMQPVNGLELSRWIRQHFVNLPVVMVTGHPAIEPEARAAGVSVVLSSSKFAEVGGIVAQLVEGN